MVADGDGLFRRRDLALRRDLPLRGQRRHGQGRSGATTRPAAIEMDQPHPGAGPRSGVAAQGTWPLPAMPCWCPPAGPSRPRFDRAGGTLPLLFHLPVEPAPSAAPTWRPSTATSSTAAPCSRWPSGTVESSLGKSVGAADCRPRVLPPSSRSSATRAGSSVRPPATLCGQPPATKCDRKGKKTKIETLGKPAWTVSFREATPDSLIVAGDRASSGAQGPWCLLVGCRRRGGSRGAASVRRGRSTAWPLPTDGSLSAPTRAGIYCFGGTRGCSRLPARDGIVPLRTGGRVRRVRGGRRGDPPPQRRHAKAICLDLAAATASWPWNWPDARSFGFYAVDPDPAKVRAAREMLDAAGLYGVRVTVHQADPATVPYPITSPISSSPAAASRKATAALPQKPRSTGCSGPTAESFASGKSRGDASFRARGPLEGAAAWTHQYADPANTLCSGDARLKGPLAMLWFRDTDLVMPSRHGRGPAPLVAEGRMFVEGLNALRAVNIYNGRRSGRSRCRASSRLIIRTI